MEIELQYLYTGDEPLVVPAELGSFTLATSELFDIRDTFFDTPALDLRTAGCSLRIRRQSNAPTPFFTWKGPSVRRSDHAREREEIEFPVDHIPTDGAEMAEMLHAAKLHKKVKGALGDLPELAVIGELENRRSSHDYIQGLHRVELCWDRLRFPLGPPQIRLELETQSSASGRFIAAFDQELRSMFGKRLVEAEHGKAKELCVRLYPELFGAQAA
ncbi:MAG: CYTH domain-containing protein [Actinobacteria bacterium]|nr:CYTH domain-containing protein [Actinomycetota bacterium]